MAVCGCINRFNPVSGFVGAHSLCLHSFIFFSAYPGHEITQAMDNTFAQQDDELLIRQIQEGRHEAFAEVVNRHSKRFYAIAYRIVFDKNDAEDIVQEAFLRLWEKRLSWDQRKEAKFTTWFYTVVVNLSLDHNRKKKPEPLSEDMQIEDRQKRQEEMLQDKQQKELLDDSLKALPERQQLALNLCFYEGLSNQEAAEIMGVNLKALQSLLMRAKMTLKEKFHQYGERGLR
jgi:RNA polymerase sigma-70 factor (ECF subfamily)